MTESLSEQLKTLFALGREVTSVLDLDELLPKLPELIARLTKFQAFAVYLLDPKKGELRIAYSVGYPDAVVRTLRPKIGEGLVGAAVAAGEPILVNDVHRDPRYVEAVPGSNAELVVPLRRKGRVIGALNLLSDAVGQFRASLYNGDDDSLYEEKLVTGPGQHVLFLKIDSRKTPLLLFRTGQFEAPAGAVFVEAEVLSAQAYPARVVEAARALGRIEPGALDWWG